MFEIWVPVPVVDWAPGALHGVRGDRIPVFHANFAALQLIGSLKRPLLREDGLLRTRTELERHCAREKIPFSLWFFENSRLGVRACVRDHDAGKNENEASVGGGASARPRPRAGLVGRSANRRRGRARPPPFLISNDSFFIYCARWFAAKSNASRTCAM